MKTLFISCILVAFNVTYSQNFISGDKLWSVIITNWGYSTEIFKMEGDSAIGQYSYTKVWRTIDSSLTDWGYQGLVREEDGVVFYRSSMVDEGILYDFTAEIGDTIDIVNMFCDAGQPVIIYDIDTVEFFGIERKRWLIDQDNMEYWVEGIGNLWGPFHTRVYDCVVCPVSELLCYHEDDELLYILPGQAECYQTSVGLDERETRNYVQVLPNPLKQGQNLEVIMKFAPKRISVYNGSGLPVKEISQFSANNSIVLNTTQLPAGLYFLVIETNDGRSFTKKLLII